MICSRGQNKKGDFGKQKSSSSWESPTEEQVPFGVPGWSQNVCLDNLQALSLDTWLDNFGVWNCSQSCTCITEPKAQTCVYYTGLWERGLLSVLGTLSLHCGHSRFWLLFRPIVWHPDSGHNILWCTESTWTSARNFKGRSCFFVVVLCCFLPLYELATW